MKNHRKWIKNFLTLIFLFFTVIILVNYTVDPMCLFAHNNIFNQKMYVIDERQQKTNSISFKDFDYDALLIGSSRVANINTSTFLPLRTYNYACKSMIFDEYYDYIEFAKEKNGRDFKYIFIGLDFFSTNKSLKNEKILKKENMKPSSVYFNNTRDTFYRIKTLLSFDCLKWSVKNILLNIFSVAPAEVYINREDNDRITLGWTVENTQKARTEQLKTYSEIAYSNYIYDDSFKEAFSKIIRANPNSKIIVFTNPVSEPLFSLMREKNLIDCYLRWMRDIVDTFGSFYHFMDINEITKNPDNYFIDAHHMYPEKTYLLSDIILEKGRANLNFGLLVKKVYPSLPE